MALSLSNFSDVLEVFNFVLNYPSRVTQPERNGTLQEFEEKCLS